MLGGGELVDAFDGVLNRGAEFREAGVGIGADIGGEVVERFAGGEGGLFETGELAAGLVEMPAEALEILLEKLGGLGSADSADHTGEPVEKPFGGGKRDGSGAAEYHAGLMAQAPAGVNRADGARLRRHAGLRLVV